MTILNQDTENEGTLVASLGAILSIWAHPDDEAYLAAATMALARAAGNRVVCVTATRGELGTPSPEDWPPERLAVLREQEMAAAMEAVGVTEHRWMGYIDGSCASADFDEAVEGVVRLIDEIRPDTILTFGPDGMTGHTDHISVSRWVTAATRRSGHSPRVLHAAVGASYMEHFDEINRRYEVYGTDGPPVAVDPVIDLDPAPDTAVQAKLAALAAHASQTDPIRADLGAVEYRAWVQGEWFVEHPG